jgi:large subunit ribosomal protein L22
LEDAMEARAIGRYLRVTPRKARLVLDAVRGKGIAEALAMLKFTPNEAAKYIRRLLESAIANAENNYSMDREALRITRAYADTGPSLKRMQPRAMGRAFHILRRTSHITIVLEEDEELREAAAARPKPKRPSRRAKEAPPAPAEPKRRKRAAKSEEKAAEAPEVEAAVEETPAEQAAEAPAQEAVSQTPAEEAAETEETKEPQ